MIEVINISVARIPWIIIKILVLGLFFNNSSPHSKYKIESKVNCLFLSFFYLNFP